MKWTPLIQMASILAVAAAATPLFAQTLIQVPATPVAPAAPTTPAAPPVVFQGQLQLITVAQMEKATYLGVSTSPVSAALRDQLSLPKGFGLVVDFVEPDSPAAKAGVQKNDILQKLGDQDLVNVQQLVTLVRAKKDGDPITLIILRDTKPMHLDATLAEKDQPVDNGMIPLTFNGTTTVGTGTLQLTPPEAAGGWQQGQKIEVQKDGDGTVQKMADGENTLTLTTKPGTEKGSVLKTLVVQDKDGKEIFNGPINTAEERAKMPAGVADKVKKLEGMQTFQLKLSPAGQINGGGTLNFGTGQVMIMPMPDGGVAQPGTQIIVRADPVPGTQQLSATSGGTSAHVLSWANENYKLNLNIATANGQSKKLLTATDVKTGKELFNGPIDTPEQQAAVPKDILVLEQAMEQKLNGGK